ncbi:MAG: aldehyde dehydrogenase family protein [Magnetovibrio sp.]|nr:aldehyde dehydrogenase family protein [Magnetovibrio sp.]
MTKYVQTISPIDGHVCGEQRLAHLEDIDVALDKAVQAGSAWAKMDLSKRLEILEKAVAAFVAMGDDIAAEITLQMGRPISQSGGEVTGFADRARHMLALAPEALKDIQPEPIEGVARFVRRVPLGVVVVLAPWNYPYLTSVNAIIPALAAGNCVVLKVSHQTPLSADRYQEAFGVAGLPDDVFQTVHMDHALTEYMISDERVDYVNFTGSVAGGHAVQKALSTTFTGSGLELGGKDAAYVRGDADLGVAVESLVDGAFFNSGQSCCGIERIYVHEDVYDAFVSAFVDVTNGYVLGDPRDEKTTLGPMVRTQNADFVRSQIEDAIKDGARALIDPAHFPKNKIGTPYLAPQVLVDVNHGMRVMREESFGPVVGIQKVQSDVEAVTLMNDSVFGLTASIWTKDEAIARSLGDDVQTGTVFMNRCDYLDPALAWSGVKQSGRGCTLSTVGYEMLTRTKSFHLKRT